MSEQNPRGPEIRQSGCIHFWKKLLRIAAIVALVPAIGFFALICGVMPAVFLRQQSWEVHIAGTIITVLIFLGGFCLSTWLMGKVTGNMKRTWIIATACVVALLVITMLTYETGKIIVAMVAAAALLALMVRYVIRNFRKIIEAVKSGFKSFLLLLLFVVGAAGGIVLVTMLLVNILQVEIGQYAVLITLGGAAFVFIVYFFRKGIQTFGNGIKITIGVLLGIAVLVSFICLLTVGSGEGTGSIVALSFGALTPLTMTLA